MQKRFGKFWEKFSCRIRHKYKRCAVVVSDGYHTRPTDRPAAVPYLWWSCNKRERLLVDREDPRNDFRLKWKSPFSSEDRPIIEDGCWKRKVLFTIRKQKCRNCFCRFGHGTNTGGRMPVDNKIGNKAISKAIKFLGDPVRRRFPANKKFRPCLVLKDSCDSPEHFFHQSLLPNYVYFRNLHVMQLNLAWRLRFFKVIQKQQIIEDSSNYRTAFVRLISDGLII